MAARRADMHGRRRARRPRAATPIRRRPTTAASSRFRSQDGLSLARAALRCRRRRQPPAAPLPPRPFEEFARLHRARPILRPASDRTAPRHRRRLSRPRALRRRSRTGETTSRSSKRRTSSPPPTASRHRAGDPRRHVARRHHRDAARRAPPGTDRRRGAERHRPGHRGPRPCADQGLSLVETRTVANWDEAVAAVRAAGEAQFPALSDDDWRAVHGRLFRRDAPRPRAAIRSRTSARRSSTST